jgi:hypothetical protein
MSVSLVNTNRQDLVRQIKRLAWFALLACIALLIPAALSSGGPQLQLAGDLAALVVVVAAWAGVRDVTRYVHQEQASRREATDASRRAGACVAADAIQDRVANLLSVTVGYIELMIEDQHLPAEVRGQADKALEGALAAARSVSTFRQTLGCTAQTAPPWLLGEGVQQLIAHEQTQPGALPIWTDAPWFYEPATRQVTDPNGIVVAAVSSSLDRQTAIANGQLLAAAPVMWSTLAEAQQLGIAVLAGGERSESTEEHIRQLLQRVNDITARLQT